MPVAIYDTDYARAAEALAHCPAVEGVARAIAAERERCAQLVESTQLRNPDNIARDIRALAVDGQSTGSEMKYEFADGCMWEGGPWFVEMDYVCSSYSGTPCRHCHSEREVVHERSDKSTWTTREWICPRVVVAENEAGHNSTGVCLDCILEAADTIGHPPAKIEDDKMSEMVERVAMAITGMFPQGDGESDGVVAVARAAIEAMREPTQAMLDAGYKGSGEDSYAVAEGAWHAMIDAALPHPRIP